MSGEFVRRGGEGSLIVTDSKRTAAAGLSPLLVRPLGTVFRTLSALWTRLGHGSIFPDPIQSINLWIQSNPIRSDP